MIAANSYSAPLRLAETATSARLRGYVVLGFVALLMVIGGLSLVVVGLGAAPVATPGAPLGPTPPAPSGAAPSPPSLGSGGVAAPGTPSPGNGPVVFHSNLPHPSSWGPSGVPPGWQALRTPAAPPAGWGSGGNGSSSSSSATNWQNRFCAGLWPGYPTLWGSNPQSVYAPGCYGHDEPGIQFYSNLPGSGGNVTWNVSLPIDRSATLNQSNLYSAIWFGMTLTDPAAWMNQCFLELQFYPDQTFYNPGPLFPNATVNGAWIGAAVAWQIEAATGAENPCFYEPLYLNGVPGPAFLNMTQGDNLTVQMTGWPGSATGEKLAIRDLTNGQSSTVVLYNSTGGFPLNPSYTTNSFQNGLQWTPGGEYPVGFAFETGHAGNYNWPSNNTYGGCSPGAVSTPADPAAPCPSYDAGAWANDTFAPWKIRTPSFFNAHTTSKPAQVGFTQDFGGIALVAQLSGGACTGLTGSAFCSYPWYSFSCAAGAFEFGATDYTGVTSDFGKYNQYAQGLQGNALGFGFYPPTNFSIPACALPTYNVTLAFAGPSGGSTYLLSHAFGSPSTVGGVGKGAYSLNAINGGSGRFDHWVTTGGLSVATKTSAWTALTVSGSGTLTAVFSATPRMTKITFADTPSGSVGLDPSMTYSGPFTGNGNPLGTIASGGRFSLSPGIYSVQAYPSNGYNFSSWSVSNGGATLAAPSFPYTWLIVTGTSTATTVTAHYVASPSKTLVELVVVGNGTATLGTLKVTNAGAPYNYGLANLKVGTYNLVGTSGSGANSVLWLYGSSVLMTNFSTTTKVNLETGFAFVEAVFSEIAPVTFSTSPSSSGAIDLLSGPPPTIAMPSGTTLGLAPGSYALSAGGFAGFGFTAWSVSGNASVSSPTSPVTTLTVSGAATVVAQFATAHRLVTVKFGPSPSKSGSVQLDGMTVYGALTSNATIVPGLHSVSAIPMAGYNFAGWNTTSHIALVGSSTPTGQVINVTAGGTVTALFAKGTYAVTFVTYEPEGQTASAQTVSISGTILHTGDTILLTIGGYRAAFSGGGDDILSTWSATSNLTLVVRQGLNVTFNVSGSGTLYAVFLDSDNDSGGIGPGVAPVAAPTSLVPASTTSPPMGRPTQPLLASRR